jgi:hypothetical protein
MNKPEYSSAIKKTPYNYLISLKIGKLMNKGLSYPAVYKKCFDENAVGIPSPDRRREVTNVVYERLIGIDQRLLDPFVNGSIATSKFILAYAIAKKDRLFSEFLLTVYRGALLGEKKYISIPDMDDFFLSIKGKNPDVAKWTVTTLRDLATGYRNILVESGLGSRNKKNIYVNHIIVSPEVVKTISEVGDEVYLQALLGDK